MGETVDREQRHGLAREARRAAEQAAESIVVAEADLQPSQVGRRYSRSNKLPIFLEGFIGWAELQGDISVALPWLLALSLAGGGQKRTMGFGVVSLDWD